MIFKKTQKLEDISAFKKAIEISKPAKWQAGLVFASPHSGRLYPSSIFKHTKLSEHQLRRNEDIFIDRLFENVVEAGVPFLKAIFPRAIVDVNRSENELPEHWYNLLRDPMDWVPTPRAAAGLGVVPTYLSETLAIYSKLPSQNDVRQRLAKLYFPYHQALQRLLEESQSRFGRALLVDCHSMPGFAPMGTRRPDIILGDRFGTSCHPDTLAQFKRLFSKAGYSVGVNYPYAGGYTTSHYGQPSNGIEAIQIEVNRDLYVNPVTLCPKKGFFDLKSDLDRIMGEIIKMARPQDLAAQ